MKTAPARAGWNNIAQSAGRPINVVVLRQCVDPHDDAAVALAKTRVERSIDKDLRERSYVGKLSYSGH